MSRAEIIGWLLAAALIGCSAPASGQDEETRLVEGSPPRLRVAAEWEPALGVLVRWPPYLPADLLVELANDTHLYMLVDDDTAAGEARTWFEGWGIDAERAHFLQVPGSDDAAWTRDFGPHPVFTAAGGFHLADARYDLSTPDSALACDAQLGTPWNGGWGIALPDYDVTREDAAPTLIATALGLDSEELPFVLTGGNFLTDGQGGALSTCVLTNENQGNGISDADFLGLAREHLGVEHYAVIPNFEDKGIQHIDCLLKLLDERRLLVARPPDDHPLHARYERVIDEHLTALRTPDGEPYQILRLDTARYAGDRLAAYTNSLILNDVVYVPLFGIPQDEVALRQWQEALPGHRVKGFPFVLADEPALSPRAHRMYGDGIGWRDFDALHCRTRAVWDPHMLHIALEPVPGSPAPADVYEVSAAIVPYSGELLLADQLELRWRVEGADGWQIMGLSRGDDGLFRASLLAGPTERRVEYYVVAADASGRRETAPRTAPRAVYSFTPIGGR
jgi:agmatine/peptidylarginine deiminase